MLSEYHAALLGDLLILHAGGRGHIVMHLNVGGGDRVPGPPAAHRPTLCHLAGVKAHV